MTLPKQYQAYRQASHTVAKTRQVVMLYDGMIRFLQQAKDAMQEKRIEERYHLLVKVSNIIMGLQNSLDFEAGKDVAQGLYDFYALLDAKVRSLHQSNDVALCDEIINEVKEMRNAWDVVDREQTKASAPAPSAPGVEGGSLEENDTAKDSEALPANGVTFSA